MTPSQLQPAIAAWLAADPDPETRAELQELLRLGRQDEVAERFARPVAFGTAGLRALLGAGPSRMNRAVIRCATAGLARWLVRSVPEAQRRGVVVARDGRHMSREFATEAAGVLAAAGIAAWVFESAVPTPLAAFAVRDLGAAAGVVVTASHNPADYNGFKVYGPNGAQVIPPDDGAISADMARAGPANAVPLLLEDEARARGLLRTVGADVQARYLAAILGERRHPGEGTDLVIAYTAMHGVGGALAVEALRQAGFLHVHAVAEQQNPDPDFPTVAFPNPEEPGALDRAQRLAAEVGAQLVLANDPDADRLGVLARGKDGVLRALTGNEVGVLLGHYLLSQGPRRPRPLLLSTVVSSRQLSHIAARLGAEYGETLTGFKWIANAALLRAAGGAHFVFGYEEALGYAVGPAVRDKDGIGAAVAMADLAGWAHARGATLLDVLDDVSRQFGVYGSVQRSLTLPGAAGVATLARIMEGFRHQPPAALGEQRVLAMSDYGTGVRTAGVERSALDLPRTNLLAFELVGGARVLLRPSGTEPKLKVYVESSDSSDTEPLDVVRARVASAAAALGDCVLELCRLRGLENDSPPLTGQEQV